MHSLLISLTTFCLGAHAVNLGPLSDLRSNIVNYRENDHKIPSGSECEKILIEAQLRLGRELTAEEIKKNLPAIFARTGDKLELVAPAWSPRQGGHFCFTYQMKVRTPQGEREIGTLHSGDEVISIDLQTGKSYVNKVKYIFPAPDRIVSRLVDLKRPIDVTERHQFLSQSANGAQEFTAIEDVPAEANLFHVQDSCELMPTPRGRYVPLPGTNTVYDLQLEGEPRNFIVEDILVHNIIVKI